jgi:hypothetical protein
MTQRVTFGSTLRDNLATHPEEKSRAIHALAPIE